MCGSPCGWTQCKQDRSTYCQALLDGAVFPSCHVCRAVFPLCHTLAGLCSSHATHTGRTVFPPLCYTLTGPCSPYAACSQERSPICYSPAGPCFLYAISSLCLLLYHIVTGLSCPAARKPSFIYPPLLVSVRGSGFQSARQLTDLKGGVLMG